MEVGNLRITANGGLQPTAFSKTKLTPVAFNASGKIETKDGTHPPAVQQVIIEGDKNVAVDTTGYPTCSSGKLQARDTQAALSVCKPALIGEGTTEIEVAFPESKPIPVNSKLLVFNGGTAGGVTTFFIHAYITVPTPAAVVTTVKIKKIHRGRFGTEAIATIPRIAGGSGSVKSFSLKIDKKYTYKGKKMSVISAKCTDGKIQANVTAKFADGTKAEAEIIRTCTPKG
ncbi:MAG TPA: hypothetical protein VF731_01475 [Solirubrobacterales bacterium]